MVKYVIYFRSWQEVNTDPMRRCYYGVHAKSEFVPTNWQPLDYQPTEEAATKKLEFWKDMSAEAVKARGPGARSEYKIVKENIDAQ